MAKILIGNIKGPQGPQGPQGEQGPVGPQGPQGPLPPLVNNALATEAGVAALDAVMGKTLQEQITNNKNDITELNSNIAKATYAADLKGNFGEPTFVKWNGDTLNTPYKDGKTTATLGWAIVYGTDMTTILAGAMGASVLWIRAVLPSSDSGWEQLAKIPI